MPIHPLWLTLGLAALLGLVARAGLARRRERRVCLEVARGRRLTFSPRDHLGLLDRYQNLQLIRRGHSRHIRHVLYGMSEVGALSLFSYRVECGFGLSREVREWQMAVLELTTAQAPWTAGPGQQPDGQTAPLQAGPLRIRAEHQHTLDRLGELEVIRILESAPPDAEIEVRGRLVAVAVPAEHARDELERLLALVVELGKRLSE